MTQRRVDFILGPTGSGKTWAARQEILKTPRGLVVDADFGEFPTLQFKDLAKLDEYLDGIGAYGNKYVPFRAAYTPRDADEFDIMCQMAYELGPCRLFIEEADRFPDPAATYWYNELLVRGRHSPVDITILALQPFCISKDWRRQATSLITYRQIEPDDIDWLKKLVGPLALKLPELAGPPDVPPFPRLEWIPGHGAKIVYPDGREIKSDSLDEKTPAEK